MNREIVEKEILNLTYKKILLELPTGYGKSKLAIDFIKTKLGKKHFKGVKILIVIPKNCLITNWNDEIHKWIPKEADKLIKDNITYTTYISLPKHVGEWDIIVFDEGHHITERCIEALSCFKVNYSLILSATVKKAIRKEIKTLYPDLYRYAISTRTAIEEEVLPDPRVILLPLKLDSTNKTETITIKKTGKKCPCTPERYYEDMSNLIEWWKKKAMYGNQAFKNIWLHKAGERLKWLSNQKSNTVLKILKKLSSYRTLTFCNSIKQAEFLGKNSIHSKNKESIDTLEKFNTSKIDHITSVQVLDEGINLVNCQIGIYANLNSSDRIIKQRLGRILRHKDPVIIVPFYLNTREEEIVKKMLEDYNPKLISTIYKLDNLHI